MTPVALTVAGSDPSGGAGIQADLKTFHQHGVYGAAVIALLTVQNTRRLTQVVTQPAQLIVEQLDAVAEDLPIAAMKTGALGGGKQVRALAAACKRLGLRPIVDPVRLSKAGATLLDDEARQAMRAALLPQAMLVTPNLNELSWLTGRRLEHDREILAAGQELLQTGVAAVLVKGGHRPGPPNDILLWERGVEVLEGQRIPSPHTHGVGCTLSAAICARVARGEDLAGACRAAKAWLQAAIAASPGIGHGQAAVDHLQPIS